MGKRGHFPESRVQEREAEAARREPLAIPQAKQRSPRWSARRRRDAWLLPVVTPTGEVWVTVLAENVIARLDGAAHRFIFYHIPTPGSKPLGIVMGPEHTFWFNEMDKIGLLRP
jgi:hypothetical protein